MEGGADSVHFTGLAREGGGSRLLFGIRDVDLAIVNSMRRALMAEVPTAAFRFDPLQPATNGVIVKANTSTLHNEIVGHRLSLVPINFDANQLRVFDPAQWRFTIRVKNQGNSVRLVTTADFDVHDQSGARVPPQVQAMLFPPCRETGDHALLLQLKPSVQGTGNGEELHVECTATLGTGRQHARWSPVSLCTFRNRSDPLAAEIALAARLDAARKEGATDDEVDAIRADWAALDAHRYFVRDEHGEPTAFDFALESEAPRSTPEYLVFKALSVLHDRVGKVALGLRRAEQANGAAVTLRPVPYVDDFYEVCVSGEDHTLGNLLQALLYRRWVRDGRGADVSFIGYHQPHPLEDRIVFKIKCARPRDDPVARFVDGAEYVQAELLRLCLEWVRVSGLASAGIVEINELVRTRGPKSVAARVKAGSKA